ncbi:MAG: hypothetical protein SGARI_000498 [Bacillariaceae sp.]
MPQILNLPRNLGNLPNLRDFTLNELPELRTLPESIGNLSSLRSFTLHELAELNSLPECIGNLSNLRSFTLSELPELGALPESIGDLTNLSSFTLYNLPKIYTLPESLGNFGNLANLQKLHADFSHLERFPESLNLSRLESLDMAHDIVHCQLPDSALLPALKEVDTTSPNLSMFPPAVLQSANVRDLTLKLESQDPRADFSESLRHWNDLTHLCIYTDVDDTLYFSQTLATACPKLEELSLSSHEGSIVMKMDELGSLQYLKKLEVESCKISSNAIEGTMSSRMEWPSMEHLLLHDVDMDPLLLINLHVPNMKSVVLGHGERLNTATFEHLVSEWFPHVKTLKQLDVSHSMIEDVSLSAISVLSKTGLVELNLTENPILEGYEDDIERMLLPIIEGCPSILEFDGELLGSPVMREVEAIALAVSLNRARKHILGGQRVAKSLWPTILSKADKAFVYKNESGNKLRSHLKKQDEVYTLLRKRAAFDLFNERGERSLMS